MRRKRGPTVRAEWMGWGVSLTSAQWLKVGQTVRAKRIQHKDRVKIEAIMLEVRGGA